MLAPWKQDEERLLLADACQRDFFLFLKYAFGVALNPRGHWLAESVHRPLCQLLELEGRRWLERRRHQIQGRTKVMVCVPRGYGKTVVVTKAFPLWLHLHDPDLACVIDSESAAKAQEFLGPVKTLLENGDPYALFTWLYGSWYSPDRIWRDSQFTHALRRQMALTEPSFDTCSVETGATGSHPDLLVLDDPISIDRIREKGNWIELAVTHAQGLTPALRTDSFFLIVGTPYTQGDVLNTFLAQDGVAAYYGMKPPEAFPSESQDGQWNVFFLQARNSDGESTLPSAWTTKELDDYERKRPMDFAAQMMCTPGTGHHMPISPEQIEDAKISREDLPTNLFYTIHLDTAFKEQKRMMAGDESVIIVAGHDLRRTGDVYYLEGYGSNKWRLEDFTKKLVEIVQRLKKSLKRVRAITDEREMGGKEGLWETHLRSCFADAGLYMPPLKLINRAGTRKAVRITEAAGYWVDGHMKLVDDAPGLDRLVRQMLQIGVSAHDDWADAAADIFHPEVYNPMLPTLGDDMPEVRRPFDDYLLSGRLTDDGAREAYDRLIEAEEDSSWAITER